MTPVDRALCLAVDVGGSATRAALVDLDGRCHGFGRAGAGNPTSSGPGRAAAGIVAAVTAALVAAGRPGTSVTAAVAGIAGAGGRPGVELQAELGRAELGFELSLQPDLLACFRSGTTAPDGYALIAGTGAVAARIDGRRIAHLCDGSGWLVGDSGSGFWIGRRVLRAAVDHLEGRGPETAMTAGVLAALDPEGRGAPRGDTADGRPAGVGTIVAAVYAQAPVAMAQLAPLAFAAAADGDPLAALLVGAAADELARTVGTVLTDPGAGGLVVGGSVGIQPQVFDRLRSAYVDAGGSPDDVRAVPDGLAGAAALAIEQTGATVDAELLDRLTTELARHR